MAGKTGTANVEFVMNSDKFVKGGEEAKKAISGIRQELKLNKLELDNSSGSVDKLNERQNILAREMDVATKNTQRIREEMEQTSKRTKENGEMTDEAKDHYNELNKELVNAQIQEQQIQKDINATTSQIDAYNKKTEEAVIAQEEATKAQEEERIAMEQAAKEAASLHGIYKNAVEKTKEFGEKTQELGEKLKGVSEKSKEVGDTFMPLTKAIVGVGAAVSKAWEIMDDAFDNMINKTGLTGKAAEELQGNMENVFRSLPVDANMASDAVAGVSVKFKLQGKELEDLSSQFIQYSKVNNVDVAGAIKTVGHAMDKFGVDTNQAGNVLGLFTGVAQHTGISVDDLSSTIDSNGAVLKEMGFDLAQSANLLGGFEANGVDAGKAMVGLKKAVAVATKEGKSLDEVLGPTIESIRNTTDETEAMQIAAGLFGNKAAPEMTQAIREGKLSFDGLNVSMGEFSTVVSDTFEATLDPPDKMRIALNKLEISGAKLGDSFLKTVTPMVEKLVDGVEKATKWFDNLDEGTKKTIVTAGLIVAAIAPVAIGIEKITALGSTALSGIGKIESGLSSLWGTIVAFPEIAIVVGLAAITVALYESAKKAGEAQGSFGRLNEEQRNTLNATNEVTQAMNEQNDVRASHIDKVQQEYDGYQLLVDELNSIVDENGKVKQGYEDRAQVITSTLADAFGVEITMQDGVIQGYGAVMEAIDQVMIKKKADAMLTAMQDDFINAYEQQKEAVKALNQAMAVRNQTINRGAQLESDLKKVQTDRTAIERDSTLAADEKARKLQELDGQEQALIQSIQNNADAQSQANESVYEAQAAVNNLGNEINDYNSLQEAAASNNVTIMELTMNKIQEGYSSFTSEMLANSEAQRQALFDQTTELTDNLQTAQDKSIEVGDDVYKNMANAAASSIGEFNKLPGGMVDALNELGPDASAAIIKSFAQAKIDGTLTDESKKNVKSFVDGFKGLDKDTQKQFAQAYYGALRGLDGFENICDPAIAGVDAFLNSLSTTLDTGSPSKAVQRIFGQVWPGATEGLQEGQDSVFSTGSSVTDQFLKNLGLENLKSTATNAGKNLLESFGVGIDSKNKDTQNRGKTSATEANKGLGLVDPTSTGSAFSTLFGSGVGSVMTAMSEAGKKIADGAKSAAGGVTPYDTGSTFTESFKKGITSIETESAGQDRAQKAKDGYGKLDAHEAGKTMTNSFAGGLKAVGFPLPHIKVDGGKIPWGIGGKGEKPTIGIDWYAKGGILTDATIFGLGSSGNFMGGGEAGYEAVLPIELLRDYIQDAMSGMFRELPSPDPIDYDKLATAMSKQPINILYKNREVGRMVKGVT